MRSKYPLRPRAPPQPLCATGWADQSDPGLSGGLRELNNAPAERGQVSGRPCDRGVNSRVNKDVDHASFTRRHTAVHTTVAGPSGHLPTLGRRVAQLTETTGQPGLAVIGPASRAQRLAAQRAL